MIYKSIFSNVAEKLPIIVSVKSK